MKHTDPLDAFKDADADTMISNAEAKASGCEIKDPMISVCRRTKTIACFDCVTIIRDFQPYDSESGAIADAIKWFDERGIDCPRIVYPHISKLFIT